MGQTFSFHDKAVARAPMLDWPDHLFSENATMAELLFEDWARACVSSFRSYDQPAVEDDGEAAA